MSYKKTYNWNEKTGKAIVKIEDNSGHIYLGMAQCCAEDDIIKNEKFGLELAEMRAKINILREIRDTEIKPQIKIIKHLFSNMQTNKQFNPSSYEACMVRRQLRILNEQLISIKNTIKDCNEYIKNLIQSIPAMHETYKKIENIRLGEKDKNE